MRICQPPEKCSHGLSRSASRETEPLEHPGHLGLHGVAAALQELLLQLRVAVEVGLPVADD